MRRWSWPLLLCCLLAACGGATLSATSVPPTLATPTLAPTTAPTTTLSAAAAATPTRPQAATPPLVPSPTATAPRAVTPTRTRTPTRGVAPATPVAGFPVALDGTGPARFLVTLPGGLLTFTCAYQGEALLTVTLHEPATNRSDPIFLLPTCRGTGGQAFVADTPGPTVVEVSGTDGPYHLTFGTLTPAQLAAAPAAPHTFGGTGPGFFLVALPAGRINLAITMEADIFQVRLYTPTGGGDIVFTTLISGVSYTMTIDQPGVYVVNVLNGFTWTLALRP